MNLAGKDIYEDGEFSGRTVDVATIDALATGTLEAVDVDTEDEVVTVSRTDILKKVLAAKLRNKIYVGGVFAQETQESDTESETEENDHQK